jgi:DNA-binding response OmpR family regulator
VTERILIIDDDLRLAEMLGHYLRERGVEVQHRPTGQGGLLLATHGEIDAVVLDVMLPDLDGFEVLRRLRQRSSVPVLMLTAKGDDTDRIVGLEMGADDYLPKPFNPRELLARLRAVLRRSKVAPDTAKGAPLDFGRLRIDAPGRLVWKDGEARRLTGYQFDLLVHLASHAGRVVSRDQLVEAVRGDDLQAFDRSIDVHISRIRAVLEDDPKDPQWIRTIRGTGYVFSRPEGE